MNGHRTAGERHRRLNTLHILTYSNGILEMRLDGGVRPLGYIDSAIAKRLSDHSKPCGMVLDILPDQNPIVAFPFRSLLHLL